MLRLDRFARLVEELAKPDLPEGIDEVLHAVLEERLDGKRKEVYGHKSLWDQYLCRRSLLLHSGIQTSRASFGK